MHLSVIKQLSDIGIYLKQFGLALSVCEYAATCYVGTSDTAIPNVSADDIKMTSFEIPRELAGVIFGREGSVLRGLQKEFGCKIRVEPSHVLPAERMRKVYVWHNDDSVHSSVELRVQSLISMAGAAAPSEISVTGGPIDVLFPVDYSTPDQKIGSAVLKESCLSAESDVEALIIPLP